MLIKYKTPSDRRYLIILFLFSTLGLGAWYANRENGLIFFLCWIGFATVVHIVKNYSTPKLIEIDGESGTISIRFRYGLRKEKSFPVQRWMGVRSFIAPGKYQVNYVELVAKDTELETIFIGCFEHESDSLAAIVEARQAQELRLSVAQNLHIRDLGFIPAGSDRFAHDIAQ